MPIYEYRCDKCEREFEAEQRITEPPLRACPHCRARKVRRLISQTSFVLKGGGWYSDLYSSKSKSAGDSAGDAKESKETKEATPTETKPDGGAPKGGEGPGGSGGKKGKKKSESKAAA